MSQQKYIRNNPQKNTKATKKFTTKMRQSLLLFFCGIIILLIVLILVMVKIHQQDGERYEKRVLNQQTYVSSVIPYRRGDILDRNGSVLATSKKVYNLVLDAKLLVENDKYLDTTLQAVSDHFKIERSELDQTVKDKAGKSYVVLQKEIDADTVNEFKEKMGKKENNIKGVWFEEKYKRYYPYNTLASSVLGFSNANDAANGGLELYYSNDLNGTNGREYGYFDSELNLVRNVKDAKNGNNIVITLDANVQRIVQEEIELMNKETPSNNIGVIVMNPNNGDILAMATDKEYNLNEPYDLSGYFTKSELKKMSEEEKQEFLYGVWRNYCISDAFEPGSTFKPFTIAAALEEGVITKDSEFYCDGYERVGRDLIHCANRNGHGHITLTEALIKSCNDALMDIGFKLGRKEFYRYQKNFLIGEKTNIDLPGEAIGLMYSEDKLKPSELATSSFGQSNTSTMIQIASGFSALVNGGYYYEPHLLKQMETSTGALVSRNNGVLVNNSITKSTSDFLKQALYETVEKGTAIGAKVEGYAVGGKTGTAQKHPRGNGKYILSFIGAVPIDNPEVVIYVVVDEYQDEARKSDSSVATKFASRVLSKTLPFLNVYPDGPVDYTTLGQEPLDKTEGEKDKVDTTTKEESKKEESSSSNSTSKAKNEKDTVEKEEDKPQEDEYNPDVLADENGKFSEDKEEGVNPQTGSPTNPSTGE